MEHELKCWPHEFDAVRAGVKTFEVRSNLDRDFAVGDVLVLQKWDPVRSYAGVSRGCYIDCLGFGTSQSAAADTERVRVTYVLHGGRFGLPPGVAVMSIVRDGGES